MRERKRKIARERARERERARARERGKGRGREHEKDQNFLTRWHGMEREKVRVGVTKNEGAEERAKEV